VKIFWGRGAGGGWILWMGFWMGKSGGEGGGGGGDWVLVLVVGGKGGV